MSVSVRNLKKTFGDIEALKGVSFEVKTGERFGFIGPDGAGKSTLFRILVSLLLPDSGEARVVGLDPVTGYIELRRRVGYMPGRFSLYQDLSVEENLTFFATIFNTTVAKNYHLIRDIYHQIEPFKKRRAGDLSGGMKQKLALSCALVHKPDILFLDEPTTGVDAVSRREFWDMLDKLKESGLTVLVSTPYMDEASRCDRIALMHRGEILEINTPEGISNNFGRDLWAVHASQRYRLLKILRAYSHAESVFAFGEQIHYTDRRHDFDSEELESWLASQGLEKVQVKKIRPSVEDALIALIGREAGGDQSTIMQPGPVYPGPKNGTGA
ncbi:MAG: ABC transporter ATP-binding protein [Balneolales bacterium]